MGVLKVSVSTIYHYIKSNNSQKEDTLSRIIEYEGKDSSSTMALSLQLPPYIKHKLLSSRKKGKQFCFCFFLHPDPYHGYYHSRATSDLLYFGRDAKPLTKLLETLSAYYGIELLCLWINTDNVFTKLFRQSIVKLSATKICMKHSLLFLYNSKS